MDEDANVSGSRHGIVRSGPDTAFSPDQGRNDVQGGWLFGYSPAHLEYFGKEAFCGKSR